MDIKRSTYYYQKKVDSVKEQQEILLQENIQRIAYQYPYYGYQRITAQLHRDNVKVNHKRVLRLLKVNQNSRVKAGLFSIDS